MKIITSKLTISITAAIISSIILSIYIVIPLLQKLDDIITLYEPVLNETTPTIHIGTGKIEFEGHIPQQITLANGVQVFFDTMVNDSLFQDAPVRSVFIAKDQLWFKSEDDIHKVLFDSISIGDEPIVLRPLEVKEKLYQFRSLAFSIVAICSIICLFLIVLILANFGAGIGIMIDAFTNGPHSFKELLNVASVILFLFVLVWIIFSAGTLSSIKIVLILYFTLIAAFVYLKTLLSRSGRKNPTSRI